MWSILKEDARVAFERDPAARNRFEVLFCYPGVHALLLHRLAHRMWRAGWRNPARLLGQLSRFLTGVEIHPGAAVGRRFFIDHGMGVVIGETAEVGDDVTLFQGVTLGGVNLRREKRHPTVEDGVVIGAGAAVLGPVVVGRNSRIGSGSVVVRDVPENATVVGVPGKVVEGHGVRRDPVEHPIPLDHDRLPDPMAKSLDSLAEYIRRLEKRVNELDVKQGSLEARQRSRRPAGTGTRH